MIAKKFVARKEYSAFVTLRTNSPCYALAIMIIISNWTWPSEPLNRWTVEQQLRELERLRGESSVKSTSSSSRVSQCQLGLYSIMIFNVFWFLQRTIMLFRPEENAKWASGKLWKTSAQLEWVSCIGLLIMHDNWGATPKSKLGIILISSAGAIKLSWIESWIRRVDAVAALRASHSNRMYIYILNRCIFSLYSGNMQWKQKRKPGELCELVISPGS